MSSLEEAFLNLEMMSSFQEVKVRNRQTISNMQIPNIFSDGNFPIESK